jgi:cytochrome b
MTTIQTDPAQAVPAGTTDRAARIRVWDVPTRVFHWLFALSFAGAWLTAESERLRDLHVMLGYSFAGLIVFRLIWGLTGTRYARFDSFLFSLRQLANYLSSLFARQPEHHLGHNPAGALAIFAMLFLGVVITLSGYATYRDIGGEWLEEVHETIAGAMLALVAVHIAGVVVSSILHRENLAAAMVTGWKRGAPTQGIGRSYPLLGALLLALVLGFWWIYLGGTTDNLVQTVLTSSSAHGPQHDDD